MPIIILSGLLQLLLVVHCLKTGRDTKWIWVLVMMPFIGAAAYVILEAGPDFLGSSVGRNAKRAAQNKFNPNKDIREASDELARADTVKNTTKLAEECMNKGQYSEAETLYQKSLRGLYETDPHILSGLAQAQFSLNKFDDAISSLDLAIEKNPDYKNQDSHLLYARAKEAIGDSKAAAEEYESLIEYFTGPEPAYHYAMMLCKEQQPEKAKALLEHILEKTKLAPKHYYSQHKIWIDQARKELANLK